MFTLSLPSAEAIRTIVERQASAPFSYPDVGATRAGATLPSGYNIDRYRVRLGAGEPAFDRAKAAVAGWRMFEQSWIRIYPENAPIRSGSVVAVVPAHFGFYSVNLCRIVYAVDSTGSLSTYGFAYGTLPAHAESGEERFTVHWDRSDDSVWYEILAVSRPRALAARIGYPLSRALQRRFGRTSLASMTAAVNSLPGI